MAAGPIGPLWVSGSWSDTAWESESWQTAITGAATATILVSASGAGVSSNEAVTGGVLRARPPVRQVLVRRQGGAIAALRVTAHGHVFVRHAGGSIAAVVTHATATGQARHGAAAVARGSAVHATVAFTAHHPIVVQPQVMVAVRSRRAKYLEAIARQQMAVAPVPVRHVPRDDDDALALALLEVA